MHILYFPYTHLADDAFDTLSACFDKITVYQSTTRHTPETIRSWAETGRLEVRIPARAFSSQIEEGLKSLQALGALYGGQPGGITNFPPPGIPFQDESSLLKIQSNLKRMIQEGVIPEAHVENFSDTIIHACLFLQFAQEFDSHQEALGRNLKQCETVERELFSHLRGDDEERTPEAFSPSPGPPTAVTRREHMLPQRLTAWTRLFLYDWAGGDNTADALDSPILLVTSDRLAFDEILAQPPENTTLFDLTVDRTGGSLRELAADLGRLAGGEGTAPPPSSGASGEDAIRIQGALIPDLSPCDFLAPFAGIRPAALAVDSSPQPRQNTLICLISG